MLPERVTVNVNDWPSTTESALAVSDLVLVRINYLFYLNYLQIIGNQ